MARSKTDIKAEITNSFINHPVIQSAYGLTPGLTFEQEFSLVSLENILFEIITFTVFTLEKLFDNHRLEIDIALAEQKRGSLAWYRTMALAFQYGFPLITDSDQYDNTGYTPEEIEASKIVKYSAVEESQDQSRVIVKIAGEKSGILTPILQPEKESFEAYINEIKFAGVKTTVINYLPDRLYLSLKIFRDPLVIDEQGNSIVDGGRPVETAIQEYLRLLPFNGQLVLAHLINHLQQVPGVTIPHLMNAQSSWIDPNTGGYEDPKEINVFAIPVSGYYEIVNFDNIEYHVV